MPEKAKARVGSAGEGNGVLDTDNASLAQNRNGSAPNSIVRSLSPKAAYRFVTPEQLESFTRPEQVIQGVVPGDSLGMIYGPPGSYKSFLSLDMGLHVAAGEPWLGRAVTRGPVLFIMTEGVGSLQNRFAAWKHEHPDAVLWERIQDMIDEDGFREFDEDGNGSELVWNVFFYQSPVQFGQPFMADEFVKAMYDHEVYPRMVVIDTLSRSARGLDENNQGEMGRFMQGIETIKHNFSCAVVLIHHSNRQGQYRGSSVLHGEVDFMIEMKATSERITATCMKQRDLELFAPMHFEPRVVELEPAKGLMPAVSSVVPEEVNAQTTFNAELAWQTLADLYPDGATDNEWKRSFMERGGTRSTYYRVRAQLLEQKMVTFDGEHYRTHNANSSDGTDMGQQSPMSL